MPHMSNMPWTVFYILISLSFILFLAKENFNNFSSSSSYQNSKKITTLNFKWLW